MRLYIPATNRIVEKVDGMAFCLLSVETVHFVHFVHRSRASSSFFAPVDKQGLLQSLLPSLLTDSQLAVDSDG